MGPLALDHILGPEALQDVEVFVHDLAALIERHAYRIELALVPACSHGQQEAATGELIDARQLLGQHHGIAQRQHQNAR